MIKKKIKIKVTCNKKFKNKQQNKIKNYNKINLNRI